MKAIQNKITSEMLLQDLQKAGIVQGDSLAIHSSLKSIGFVEGGALSVIETLYKSVGENGGIIFPCLTFSGSVTMYLRDVKCIDMRKVNISTGAMPKAMWEHPDACKSLHPTHPVAGLGKKAEQFTDGIQSGQGPVGTDSPFYRLAMSNGKILMIGVSLESCTLLHCVEEIAAPYIFCGDTFNVETIDFQGNSHYITVKGYCLGIPRDFPKIESRLLSEGIMKIKSFGKADLRIIDAKAMLEYVTQWVKKEPWLLVSDEYHHE